MARPTKEGETKTCFTCNGIMVGRLTKDKEGNPVLQWQDEKEPKAHFTYNSQEGKVICRHASDKTGEHKSQETLDTQPTQQQSQSKSRPLTGEELKTIFLGGADINQFDNWYAVGIPKIRRIIGEYIAVKIECEKASIKDPPVIRTIFNQYMNNLRKDEA